MKTDGWAGYSGLKSADFDHQPTVQGWYKLASKALPWVHIVMSNFKRWTLDAFHGVSRKHLQSYLDEFCYRLNRRYQRKDIFRKLITLCVKYSGPVSYAQLTGP